MTHPNIPFIQSLYAAFQSGRIDTIIAALAPNVDWEIVGRSQDYPAFGPKHGKAAVADFFKLVAENEDYSEFAPREFVAADDRVFVLGSYKGKLKKTGKAFASEWIHVFTIKDGKVARLRGHTDTAQFAEAFRG